MFCSNYALNCYPCCNMFCFFFYLAEIPFDVRLEADRNTKISMSTAKTSNSPLKISYMTGVYTAPWTLQNASFKVEGHSVWSSLSYFNWQCKVDPLCQPNYDNYSRWLPVNVSAWYNSYYGPTDAIWIEPHSASLLPEDIGYPCNVNITCEAEICK